MRAVGVWAAVAKAAVRAGVDMVAGVRAAVAMEEVMGVAERAAGARAAAEVALSQEDSVGPRAERAQWEAAEVRGGRGGGMVAAARAAAARAVVAASKVVGLTGVAAKAAKAVARGCCYSIRRNRSRVQQAAST